MIYVSSGNMYNSYFKQDKGDNFSPDLQVKYF